MYCAPDKPYASIMDSRVTADTGDGTKDSKVESKAAVRKGDMMAYDGRFGQRSYDLMGGGRRRCVLASTRRRTCGNDSALILNEIISDMAEMKMKTNLDTRLYGSIH